MKKAYEVFYYADPNMGWGYMGHVAVQLAANKDEAIAQFEAERGVKFDMRYGIQEVDVDEMKEDIADKLNAAKAEVLLYIKTLNKLGK
jgi:hypothetical protein